MDATPRARLELLRERTEDIDERLDELSEKVGGLTVQCALLGQKLDLHAHASKDSADRLQIRLDVLAQAVQERTKPLTVRQISAIAAGAVTVITAISAAVVQVIAAFK